MRVRKFMKVIDYKKRFWQIISLNYRVCSDPGSAAGVKLHSPGILYTRSVLILPGHHTKKLHFYSIIIYLVFKINCSWKKIGLVTQLSKGSKLTNIQKTTDFSYLYIFLLMLVYFLCPANLLYNISLPLGINI